MSGAYSNKATLQGRSHFRPFNQRGMLLGVILFASLAGFEMFNFSTTKVALLDLLGDLHIFGITWASILTIAFCGIDFAGIARLFTPEDDSSNSRDTWYLFGAWLLAATMNAILTWWGISLAVVNRPLQSSAFIDPRTISEIVPIFLALMIWITRVLLIGSFSIAGSRQFSTGDQPALASNKFDHIPHSTDSPLPVRQPMTQGVVHSARIPRPVSVNPHQHNRPELEYIPEPDYVEAGAAFHTLAGQSKLDRSTHSPKRF